MKANINDIPIKVLNLPKRYTRINGVIVDGYDTQIQFHYEDGFSDVIIPTYDNTTHRLGVLVIQGDEITYEVIELTPGEIEQQLFQVDVNIIQTEVNDGVEASNRLRVYLKRNLTPNQYKAARTIVMPVWIALRNGNFDIALDEMNAISVSTEPYVTMKQVIITEIEEYL